MGIFNKENKILYTCIIFYYWIYHAENYILYNNNNTCLLLIFALSPTQQVNYTKLIKNMAKAFRKPCTPKSSLPDDGFLLAGSCYNKYVYVKFVNNILRTSTST